MGLPAIDYRSQRTRTRKPALRVVKNSKSTRKVPTRRASTLNSSSARAAHSARSAFRAFTAMALLVAALGVGRVWLSVQAAEASMEANRLRSDIKSERYEGDMLEVRQSALGSPSRIRAIAGEALDMAPAKTVTYLDIQQPTKESADAGVPASKRSGLGAARPESGGVMSFVSSVMRLSAGEAQVLLVGDVGLTSAK